MTATRYAAYALVAAGFVLFAWVVNWAGDILTPFIIAFILAYLTDPLVSRLEGRYMPRSAAALVVTVGIVFVIMGVLSLLGPMIYEQLVGLLRNLPTLLERAMATIQRYLLPYFPMLHYSGDFDIGPQMDVKAIAGPLASSVLSGGLSLATALGLTLLTPVITFYLLVDWNAMIARIRSIIPYRNQAATEGILHQMDMALSGFLRGQAYVCLCMAVIYTGGLMLAGLNYALLIGVLSGLLKYLPYIGTAIGVLLATLTGLSQGGWDPALMIGIALTYGIGEFIESSILTPKLVGETVRLPPVVVIFAVLLGGKLLGLIGVFVAVPLFATMRVIATHWLDNSAGTPPPEP